MNKLLITILLIIPELSFGYGDWVGMQKTGSRSINSTYSECYYKELLGEFTISITIKGSTFSCPYTIQYNPVTGKWKG